MEEHKQEQQPEQSQEQRQPLLRRVGSFLLTAVLVLGSVFLVANWQKLDFDYIRRAISYRSLQRNENGQVESFSYGSGLNSSFLQIGEDLLVVSSGGIQLYSPSGSRYVNESCTLTQPILKSGGGLGLVYDAGGSSLYVLKDRAVEHTMTLEKGSSILSASLSAQGQLTVVTQSSGVKGIVTVYDSSFAPKFGVDLSSSFITDAVLSPDGNTLALATAGVKEGLFHSQILFYHLNHSAEDSTADATCDLGNETVLQLNWETNPLRVVGETSYSLVDTSGELVGQYDYAGRYLKAASTDGSGFGVLLLGKYRAGTTAELVSVNDKGQEKAVLPIQEQVLGLSAGGRYVSLLTAGKLDIYDSDLSAYHTATELRGARKVLQRADGSVTLISSDNARLYLPE